MRTTLVVAVALSIFAATAGSAKPAVSWPAQCHTFRCVNKHLNNLDNRVRVLRQFINCEALVPLTQYADFELAGDAETDGAPITGLDVTADGDTVDAWFIIDACEPATTPRPVLRRSALTPRRVGD